MSSKSIQNELCKNQRKNKSRWLNEHNSNELEW